MNKENCTLNLVDEIILYYDARSQKLQKVLLVTLEFLFHCRSLSVNVVRLTV